MWKIACCCWSHTQEGMLNELAQCARVKSVMWCLSSYKVGQNTVECAAEMTNDNSPQILGDCFCLVVVTTNWVSSSYDRRSRRQTINSHYQLLLVSCKQWNIRLPRSSTAHYVHWYTRAQLQLKSHSSTVLVYYGLTQVQLKLNYIDKFIVNVQFYNKYIEHRAG